jgi:molecular chaperone DnaK (HSP70)
MGRKFDEVREEIKRLRHKMARTSPGEALVEVEGKPNAFRPPAIAAMIFTKLKAAAEARLGEPITQVFEVGAPLAGSHRDGNDWESRLRDWINDACERAQRPDLRRQPDALQSVQEEHAKAKLELSSVPECELDLSTTSADAGHPKHLGAKLTGSQWEPLGDDFLGQTVELVKSRSKPPRIATDKMDARV